MGDRNRKGSGRNVTFWCTFASTTIMNVHKTRFCPNKNKIHFMLLKLYQNEPYGHVQLKRTHQKIIIKKKTESKLKLQLLQRA